MRLCRRGDLGVDQITGQRVDGVDDDLCLVDQQVPSGHRVSDRCVGGVQGLGEADRPACLGPVIRVVLAHQALVSAAPTSEPIPSRSAWWATRSSTSATRARNLVHPGNVVATSAPLIDHTPTSTSSSSSALIRASATETRCSP